MFRRGICALFAVLTCWPAFAAHTDQTFSMMGLTHEGDTAELRFDPAPSATGRLVILGDRTHSEARTVAFSYRILPVTPHAPGNPTVEMTFGDKQSLTIFCDPLSDNCRSTDFVTEDGITFSLLWRIERH